LIASHIKPWSQDEKNRLNPANGICLSATLDRAFDKGLISINKDFEVIFSNKLTRYSKEGFFETEIKRFENIRMNLPIKFLPGDEFIEYHNDVIFQK
jgi:putative restriction endonuclease